MTMDKQIIKDIMKRWASIDDSTVNGTTKLDYGLQKIQAIDFLSMYIQYLVNYVLTMNVTLFHEI